MMRAHEMYTAGDDAGAFDVLHSMTDRVWAAAQLRFYWGQRWKKNAKLERAFGEELQECWPPPVFLWICGLSEAHADHGYRESADHGV